MAKKTFDKIMAGVEDAAAYTQGDTTRWHAHVPLDVRAIRIATGLSQESFARRYGLEPGTLRNWEQSIRQPDGAARTLLRVIEREPEAVARALAV